MTDQDLSIYNLIENCEEAVRIPWMHILPPEHRITKPKREKSLMTTKTLGSTRMRH